MKYSVSKSYLIKKLGRYFNSMVPDGAVECDYELVPGPINGVYLAKPNRPGNDVFYSWVASHDGYYPAYRWEYGVVSEYMLSFKRKIRIVDVGCGDGRFLKHLRGYVSFDLFGIDMLGESIDKCRASGFNAYCGTAEQILMERPELAQSFDFVCSFHCLEHVPDPKSFLGELIALLAEDGVLCISTPLSPMPIDSAWFDPQNFPPHHLSRWTLLGYRNIAAELGFDVEFFTPKTGSVFQWIWRTLKLRITDSPFRRVGRRDMIAVVREVLFLPFTAFRVIQQQARAEVAGCDTVLVFFRKKK